MSALIAAFASQNARQKRSCQIQSQKRKDWLKLNKDMSEKWPNIGQKIDAMPNADAMQDEDGKFDKYFSDKQG